MKAEWLIQQDYSDLILFFNGWGMNARPFRSLESHHFDVLCFYDYRSLWDCLPIPLTHYKKIFVLAWSWGVRAASEILSSLNLPIHFSLAINGTLYPVHNHYGIPTAVFEKTLQRFNEKTYSHFIRRMFQSKDAYTHFEKDYPQRGLNELKEELLVFGEKQSPFHPKFSFQAAFIGQKDLIIPAQNQIYFWSQTSTLVKIGNTGHFPFFKWADWDTLLSECLHD